MENTGCINLIKKILNLKDDIKKGIYYDLSIDENLDGSIDRKEWGKNINKHLDILKKYFDVTTIEQVGEQFNLIDRNNNEQLSKNEMIKGLNLPKNRNIKIKKRIIHLLEKILN
tara:strand:- start:52 stop:393 length:342 start_codon:yes stop_codon:yes gene_type:complete